MRNLELEWMADSYHEHEQDTPAVIRPALHAPETAALWTLFPMMADVLPEGDSGRVAIRHFTITPREAQVRSIARMEVWTPGRFASLEIDGVGWMYDILQERLWNRAVVQAARGDVLIAGLGLGMILHPILRKPEVRSVHVLELNADVVKLVEPSLRGVPGYEKLRIEMTDAQTWAGPREAYDVIWLDAIPGYSWSYAFIDGAMEWMRRFRPFLRPDGWMGHWALVEVIQEVIGDGMGCSRDRIAKDVPGTDEDTPGRLAEVVSRHLRTDADFRAWATEIAVAMDPGAGG